MSEAERILDQTVRRFRTEHALFPVVAGEIEFYLHHVTEDNETVLMEAIHHACRDARIDALPVEKERGTGQYEIALLPTANAVRLVEDLLRLREVVEETASSYGARGDFSAKPFADQPGSGLHIHLHIEDAERRNLFFREEEYSPMLLHAVGGMLAVMAESMVVFAPEKDSYSRFVPGYNVPVTVSWGANNRTVAVRLPTKPLQNKHMEHRVSGADADPSLAIAAVLAAAHHGITHKLKPGEPIYGDASLPIYALPPLPRELRHAVPLARNSAFLAEYFGKDFRDGYIKQLLV